MTNQPSPQSTPRTKAVMEKFKDVSVIELSIELEKHSITLERELNAAKQQLTNWSNSELLGETGRCQFEAMKVRLKQAEKERDELRILAAKHRLL